MERYNPVAQTRPKPPRVWLFAEERHWVQQFCQMDTEISVRSTEMSGPVKADHLRGQPSEGGPKYSTRTEPKWSIPFDFELKFPEFCAQYKAPCVDHIPMYFALYK